MLVVNAKDVKADLTVGGMLGQGIIFRQALVNDKMAGSGGYGIAVVSYNPGARLSFHTHTGEQIIYCLEGAGIIATADKEYHMTPGTVIVVPPGVSHWHGATDTTPFTHLAVYKGEAAPK
jgi:quercetin dioxygenase-like cupin family protein